MFDFSNLLARSVRLHPDKALLVDVDGPLSYREFELRTRRVANGLRSCGVEPGDRVAFLGRNSIDYFELLVGLSKVGGVMTGINWRLIPADVASLIEDSGASLVFADEEFATQVPEGVERIFTGAEFASWRESQGDEELTLESTADTVVVQSYTSGTTGRAKGVIVTNRMFDLTVQNASVGFGLHHDSVIAAVMPVHHMGGAVMFAYAISLGATAAPMAAFQADEFLDFIEKTGITYMALAPVMLTMLIEAQAKRPRDISSLESALIGGGAPSSKQIAEYRTWNDVKFVLGYGASEFWGLITVIPLDEMVGDHARSAGPSFPWITLGIFDTDTGERLPSLQQGEVRGRGEQTTPGYWRRPQETADLYVDGWMRTGDIGYMDDEGHVFLTDRVKDMIKTGGENVYPAEVERILIEHPDVADVAVVGGPHEKWGEAVTAFVVLSQGSTLTPDEIVDWSRSRLGGYQRPQEVIILSELPTNTTGKILRNELRASLFNRVTS